MKSIIGGALALIVVQLAVASPLTAGRLQGLGADLATVVARFVDPTVPLIGSTAPTPAAATTKTAAATGPTYAGSGVGVLNTYSQY